MTYAEQLKHPKWQQKRLEVLQSADFTCQSCGDKEMTLNVHHKLYKKGKQAWDYPTDNFLCLCEKCHQEYHDAKETLNNLISNINIKDMGGIIGYIKAMLSDDGPCDMVLETPEEAFGAYDYFRVNVGIPMHGVACEPKGKLEDLRGIVRLVHGGGGSSDPWHGYNIRRGQ